MHDIFSKKNWKKRSNKIQIFEIPSVFHFSALSPPGFDLLTPGMGVWRSTAVSRSHSYKSLKF